MTFAGNLHFCRQLPGFIAHQPGPRHLDFTNLPSSAGAPRLRLHPSPGPVLLLSRLPTRQPNGSVQAREPRERPELAEPRAAKRRLQRGVGRPRFQPSSVSFYTLC